MSAAPRKEKYLVDTNFLFEIALWVPIPLNSVFWSHLTTSLKAGEWVLLDIVVNEIKSAGDLKNWCEAQANNGLVSSIDATHKYRGVELNNTYPMIDGTGKSETDTYLIAYAEANKLTVVSRESQRDSDTDLFKIPDVCGILQIPMIRLPLAFLKGIGFRS